MLFYLFNLYFTLLRETNWNADALFTIRQTALFHISHSHLSFLFSPPLYFTRISEESYNINSIARACFQPPTRSLASLCPAASLAFTWLCDWKLLKFCVSAGPWEMLPADFRSIIKKKKKASSGNDCRWPHCPVKHYYSTLNHGKLDRQRWHRGLEARFYFYFHGKGLKKMFCGLNCLLLFVCFLSCAEMVECEQPSVLATHPTEGAWLHSCRPHLWSCGESFPGHHRNLQGAELS